MLKEVLAPLRRTTIKDRSTRHMPHRWRLYPKWADALKFISLLQRFEDELRVSDDDDDADASEELLDEIRREAEKHHLMRRIFVDAFTDIRESLYLLKFLANAINGKGRRRVEHYTGLDDGSGCTSKSTIVDLLRVVLGVKDKDSDGYLAILKHSNLMVDPRAGDNPCEAVSNMQACVMAVIDDFHAAPNRAVDLDRLHQWTGKTPITAARKFQGEVAFIYNGAITLICNKIWKTSAASQVPDERRFTGQFYQVRFKDKPDPSKNERKKDKRTQEG